VNVLCIPVVFPCCLPADEKSQKIPFRRVRICLTKMYGTNKRLCVTLGATALQSAEHENNEVVLITYI
jgi:hypothetical protein